MSEPQPLKSAPWLGPGDPATAAGRIRETERRLDDTTRNGRTIRFVSVQFMTIVLTAGAGALGVVARSSTSLGPAFVVQVVLAVAAVMVAIAGWLWARRVGRLLPQLPQPRPFSLLAALTRDERMLLQRQAHGREPVLPEWRALVRQWIAYAQATNRASIPSLVAMGLWLTADAFWLGWWLFVVVGAMAAILVAVSAFERRRHERVLASIDSAERSESEGAQRADGVGTAETEA